MPSILFNGIGIHFSEDMTCVIDGNIVSISHSSKPTPVMSWAQPLLTATDKLREKEEKKKTSTYNGEYYQKRKQATKHRQDHKNLGLAELPFDARPMIIEHLTTNYGRSSKFHISRHVFKRSGVAKPHPWWWGKSVNKMVRDMMEEGTLTIVSKSEVGRQYDIIGLSSMIAKD